MQLGEVVPINGKRWEVVFMELDFAGRLVAKLRQLPRTPAEMQLEAETAEIGQLARRQERELCERQNR